MPDQYAGMEAGLMDVLGYVGIGILVAVVICLFPLLRDRKAKDLDKLGPRALSAEFKQQREDRNA